MRAASFAITGPDGLVADVAVIPMPGAGAPVGEMVNMWRSQLGLEPVAGEAGAQTAENAAIGAESAPLYDLVSTAELIELGTSKRKARIVGAVLPRGEMTWFFKLAGEDAQVVSLKPAFKEFLKSVVFEAATAPATVAAAPATARPGMGAGTLPPGAEATPAKPRWTAPTQWKEEPPTQMLVARFTASDKAPRPRSP
jgi:hypothetical protein